jgi:hypothetical protein
MYFYESIFVGYVDMGMHGGGMFGWQVLVCPSEVDGFPVPFDTLCNDLAQMSPTRLGDPSAVAEAFTKVGLDRHETHLLMSGPFLEDALNADVVPAVATLPPKAQSLTMLIKMSTESMLVTLHGRPAVILMGEEIGLVAIRPLSAVGGALWNRSQRSAAVFSQTAGEVLLEAVRLRLGIQA